MRVVQDEALTTKIKNIFYESKRVYGARKIQRLLRKEGRKVGRDTATALRYPQPPTRACDAPRGRPRGLERRFLPV